MKTKKKQMEQTWRTPDVPEREVPNPPKHIKSKAEPTTTII